MREDLEKINIDSDASLEHLINRFKEQPGFAQAFVFSDYDLFARFLNGADVDIDLFKEKYYYFDEERNIHISESEDGFVWISTLGLVTTSKFTDNKYVNAYSSQGNVLLLLLDEIIKICSNQNCYDIDGALYGRLQELMPTLFHNIVFYYETLFKAYLSIYGHEIIKSHSLKRLYESFSKVIIENGQENSIFYQYINPSLLSITNHINSIPGGFREEYIKYDDNPSDTTFVNFNVNDFVDFRNIVTIGMDAILDLYYKPKNPLYFKNTKSTHKEKVEIRGLHS